MEKESNLRKIVSLSRKAIEDYNMIEDGDSIAVGVSGGKDSLALLCALSELKNYYPKRFDLKAITLDMGYDADWSKVRDLCESLNVEYTVKKTQIKEVIFDIRKEQNPCSLCSKMRRGALNEAAKELGCNRVALGHHNDDAVETFFLSLFYEGRISTFAPVTYLDRTGIYQIRPMIYVSERDIRGAAKNNNFPVSKNPCPADGATKREEIKDLIKDLEKRFDNKLKKRLFTAIEGGIDEWKTERK